MKLPRIKFFSLLIRLRASFWLLPIVFTFFGMALAVVSLRVDALLMPSWLVPSWYGAISVESARSMLATFAGALVSSLTIVFSITMVTLTMASSQFGPRMIRGFLENQHSQRVLGILLGSFVFCVLVLWQIGGGATPEVIPLVSLTLSLVAMLSSLAALVYFIHVTSHNIQVGSVINQIADKLDEAIRDRCEENTSLEDAAAVRDRCLLKGGAVRSKKEGYLQLVSVGDLLEYATEHDLAVAMTLPLGEYVLDRDVIVRSWPPVAGLAGLEELVDRSIHVGLERTLDQDLLFGVRQLSEIALRALSPGINDPNTALACLNRLVGAIAALGHWRLAHGVIRDESGTPRVFIPPVTFEDFVELALAPLYTAGSDQALVVVRTLRLLVRLAEPIQDPARRRVLWSHAERCGAAGRRDICDVHVLDEIESLLSTARTALAG